MYNTRSLSRGSFRLRVPPGFVPLDWMFCPLALLLSSLSLYLSCWVPPLTCTLRRERHVCMWRGGGQMVTVIKIIMAKIFQSINFMIRDQEPCSHLKQTQIKWWCVSLLLFVNKYTITEFTAEIGSGVGDYLWYLVVLYFDISTLLLKLSSCYLSFFIGNIFYWWWGEAIVLRAPK